MSKDLKQETLLESQDVLEYENEETEEDVEADYLSSLLDTFKI